MSVRKAFAVLALGASLGLGNSLLAQQVQPGVAQPQQQGQQGQPGAVRQQGVQSQQPAVQGRAGQAGQQSQGQGNDHFIASCLAIGNQLEVATAKWAASHSDDEDVQQLTKMLIEDHSAFLEKLAKWAPDANDDGFLNVSEASDTATPQRQQQGNPQAAGQQPSTGASINQGRSQTSGQQTSSRQAQQVAGTQSTAHPAHSGGPQPSQILQMDREIAQECLQSTKKSMGEREGKDFTICFVGAQIVKHQEMLDKLTVFQRHVSPEFAQVLSDAQTTTQEHLDHALKIMEKFEGSSGRSSTAGKEKREEKRE